ncbi:putative ABC transport system permease protein [Streptomyces sp. Amel2xB2]|uniref:ABC transporter permease n=1 Tax=Streptomyces sp. Amel2xB2 TaxID=1305829 RepID=UPI000DBA40A6|nr:ABC transporter permease [Streptomyces sp. Amel2xB2]RAJ62520.1 putative ABC transport system permease protein [Streptomyces sp. Amel2xB2]
MTVFKASLRNFFAHKGRMALSAVAVLLSVAFVCGTLVFTDTMNTTFDRLFATTSPDVTVSPKKTADDGSDQRTAARPRTLPASALGTARAADGARSAEGVVSSERVTVVDGDDRNIGSTTGAPTIAANWTSGDRRTMKITSGHAPRGASEAMVDADTAKKRHLRIGDELRTIAADGDFTARISGIATFQVTNPGAAIVYFDTPTAQRQLLGRTGAYTGIAVTAEQGVTHALLKKNVSASLGAGKYTYQTQKEAADSNREEIGSFLDVMKYALLGFAGIALLVGIFLIVNTFSMLVAQRTREIGLMRAIGSSRRQVNRSVLIEALLLGVVGSVLGVGAGVGLAVGLMKLMGQLGMNLSTSELTVAWTTPVTGLVLGVLVTLLAAYLPARRAGRVSPMAALRDAGTPADVKTGAVRAVLGVLLTGGGAAALYEASKSAKAAEGSVYLGAGVVLTLVGFVVVGPVLAGALVRVLSLVTLRPFGGRVGRLAERNALRNPRRTGATAAALMIGLALVASLSVVGSSMVASATQELDRSVGADFIVQSGNGQPVTPGVERKLRDSASLKTVTSYKIVPARVTTPDGKTAREQFSATDPSYMKDLRREVTSGDLAAAYDRDAMSVGADFAKKHGVGPGDSLTVAFAGGESAKLTVAAVTKEETSVDKGAMYTDIATVRRHVPAAQMPPTVMMFGSAEDGREDAAYAALKKELKPYPQYQVHDQADFKQTLQDQVGQMLNMVYGLLALAIIVAVLGVVNTLALSVVERTREIGLMRAIGLARRQLRRMIRLESVVIALFGALLGLGLGMCWGAAAQKLLALEGLNVLEIPWPTIGAVFAGSALVGLVAALVPAFRAGRMNVLNAIATE